MVGWEGKSVVRRAGEGSASATASGVAARKGFCVSRAGVRSVRVSRATGRGGSSARSGRGDESERGTTWGARSGCGAERRLSFDMSGLCRGTASPVSARLTMFGRSASSGSRIGRGCGSTSVAGDSVCSFDCAASSGSGRSTSVGCSVSCRARCRGSCCQARYSGTVRDSFSGCLSLTVSNCNDIRSNTSVSSAAINNRRCSVIPRMADSCIVRRSVRFLVRARTIKAAAITIGMPINQVQALAYQRGSSRSR